MVEGGHFTVAGSGASNESVVCPDGSVWHALTSASTRACFRDAIREARALGESGIVAQVGLLVGDLALPGGERPVGGLWAVPPSYRSIANEEGFDLDGLRVWGEAYARNQGKRRLLDEVLHRDPDPQQTYAQFGWALVRDEDGGLSIASDASLEWDTDIRAAALTRGPAPLCPLVFAGLKRAIHQAGFRTHVALYALEDDCWIEAKLRAGATAFAQLNGGRAPLHVQRVRFASGQLHEEICDARELVAPGQLDWTAFVRDLERLLPGRSPYHRSDKTWQPTATEPAPCQPPRSRARASRCSG
jgi:hypothetical protein